MQKLFRSLLAIGAVAGLAACGDDVTVTPPAENPIAVTGIDVSPPSASIAVGGKFQFSASVKTNGGTGTIDLGVNWASSNTAVATVDASGLVTGVAAGTASITATSKADANQKASASIVVGSGVQSVTVSPNAVTLTVGQTASPSANVARDAGVAGTVTWGSNNTAVATVNSTTGLVTAVAVGNAVITATSTVDASKSASMSVSVVASAPALTGLTVTPTAVALGPGGTQNIVTTTTTGTPASGTVNVTFANTSNNTAVCTVTPTGANPTITAVANGTCVVTITATGTPSAAGSGLAVNSISQTVTVNIQASSISLGTLTQNIGGNIVPVNLAGAFGQIEATMNINAGNQQIGSVAVFIGTPGSNGCANATYVEAARQNFGVNGAPNAPVTLSVNTAAFNPTTFVPLYLNGLECIQAQIFPLNGSAPTASNTIQFTLTNQDVVYFDATVGTTANGAGLNHLGNSAAQNFNPGAGNIWWKGGFTYKAHPVLYSGVANVASITYTSSACGSANGVAPNFVATFTCAGVQSAQNITGVTINYVPTYTLTTSPAGFMTAASPGFVPGSPVFSVVTTREDNVGPSSTVTINDAGAGGWHGNGSAAINLPPVIPPTSYTGSASDGGVGVNITPAVNAYTSGPVLVLAGIQTACQLQETLTPNIYTVQAQAVADLLGNVGSASAQSAAFGVDCVVLDAQYANRATSAFPAIFAGANGTVYSGFGSGFSPDWTPINGVTDQIAIDAIDTRSGLDNNTALTQVITRSNAAGSTNCLASGTYAMTTILSDNYVQSAGQQIDCGAAPVAGEYRWRGYVSDRAHNARKPLRSGVPLDSIWIAIDQALPNITGIGFQTALYTGAQPATWSFSANDDLELKDGQVSLTYAGLTPTVTYPYGSSAYTTGAFGAPFDGVFVNVLNNAALTLGYYLVRVDFATAAAFVPGNAPSGNVAGFTSSGINTNVTANVRDVAKQPAALPLTAPVLATQIQDRSGAPGYTAMIDFRITAKSGTNALTIQETLPTSVSVQFCDRIDIYEASGAGLAAGMLANDAAITDLQYRSTVSASPATSDNGFQRFFTYVSASHTVAASGLFTAACVKAGSALFSPLL